MMNKNYYCLIMAGGTGSRFWPISTPDNPKQFIDLLGTGKSLIQSTFDRVSKIISSENIFVLTNQRYKNIVKKQIPKIKDENILLEPLKKNTSPCIAYGCLKISKSNPNAIFFITPSDHFIADEKSYLNVIIESLKEAEKNNIINVFGIKPSRPDTGYGYIEVKNYNGKLYSINDVNSFKEKPNEKTASEYIKKGNYFWNSGMFVWSAKTIKSAFQEFLPDMLNSFKNIEYNTPNEQDQVNKAFEICKEISIDYGIIEKFKNTKMYACDFGWLDLGTWGSIHANSKQDKDGNVIQGEKIKLLNCKNNIVKNITSKFLVVNGLENFIVVKTDNETLICSLKDEQNIKKISESI